MKLNKEKECKYMNKWLLLSVVNMAIYDRRKSIKRWEEMLKGKVIEGEFKITTEEARNAYEMMIDEAKREIKDLEEINLIISNISGEKIYLEEGRRAKK